MNLRATFLTVSLLLLAAVAGHAADEPKSVWVGDDRLQQRVSLSVEGLALGDLLQQLSEKTGIKLSVSAELADDKVVAFSAKRRLDATLTDLAALFNATWSHSKASDPKAGYLFFRGLAARHQEEELRRAKLLRIEAELDERVQALSETPAQLARRAKNDPVRRALEDQEQREATEVYACLSPAQREQFLTERRLRVPFSAFNALQQQELQTVLREAIERERVQDNAPNASTSEDLEKLGVSFSLEAEQQGTVPPHALVQLARGESLFLGWLDNSGDTLLPPHGDPYQRATGSALAVLPEAKVITSVASEIPWVDRLKALWEASRAPIFSDYFRGAPVSEVPPSEMRAGEDAPSVAALDAFCAPEVAAWWSKGNTLFFRKRDWFRRRPREVPDRWLASVSERLVAEGGVPKYSDLVRLHELSVAQISGLCSLSMQSSPSYMNDTFYREVPPLMELLRSRVPQADRTLPTTSVLRFQQGEAETDGFVLFKQITESLREPFLRLLQAQPIPPPQEALGGTMDMHLFCMGTSQGVRNGYREVPVQLIWELSRMVTPTFGYGYQHNSDVRLPLNVPDDRRDKTRIMVEP